MNDSRLDEVVVSPQSVVAAEEVADYWTAERMASATPLPLPAFPPSTARSRFRGAVGEPVSGNSLVPDTGMASLAACFTTSSVTNLNVFPYQTVGKLFMVFGGRDFVGSAWVIGESTICTAGHCIYNGAWATSVLFAPRYDNGADLGSWPLRPDLLAAPNGWINNGDNAYDLGFGIAFRPIRPTTGKLGWMANYPANQGPYTQIGYPASAISGFPFDGQRMWQTVGNYVDGTSIIQACGNMTGGCSGGPWAVFKENDWRGNGVNSHRYGDSDRIYTPYFGEAFVNLINWMKGNGGDS